MTAPCCPEPATPELLPPSGNFFQQRWKLLSDRQRGFFFAVLAMMGAALFSFPYQEAVQQVGALPSVFGVFVWALLFSLPGAWRLRKNTTFRPRILYISVVMAIVGVVGNYAVCQALDGNAPSLVIIITRSEIVIAMLLGWGFLKEYVTRRVWVAVAVILAGIVIMRLEGLSDASGSWSLVLWALLTAFSFASMQVLSKTIVHEIDPQALNVIRLSLALMIMAFFPGVLEVVQTMEWHTWSLLGMAAFSGPFMGRVSYTYALRSLSIAQAMTIGTCAPVVTLLIDILVFDRLPGLWELGGGALVLLGVLSSFWKPTPAPTKA